jgi:hypothetical protein
MLRWWRLFERKAAKCVYSRACTSQANVCEWLACVCRLQLMLSPQIELNQLSGIAAILTFPVDVEAALEEEKAEREAEAAAAGTAAVNGT